MVIWAREEEVYKNLQERKRMETNRWDGCKEKSMVGRRYIIV